MAPTRGPRTPIALRSLAWLAAGVGTAASVLVATAAPAVPASGRYDATLCVTSAAQAPSCGPAEVDVRAGGRVRVRVSDIVYRLRVVSGQAAVIVMQGSMQIDEFDCGAEWAGATLRFADAEKRVRYEVQVGPQRRTSR